MPSLFDVTREERWRLRFHPRSEAETSSGDERRSQPRVSEDCAAHLKFFDPSLAAVRLIDARMVDISEKGLQLRVGFIFPNGPVQICLRDRAVLGRVRYCVSAGDDFLI